MAIGRLCRLVEAEPPGGRYLAEPSNEGKRGERGFWGLGGVLPFLLDAFEVFGGSELGIELVGDRVMLLGAIGVVALAVEKG